MCQRSFASVSLVQVRSVNEIDFTKAFGEFYFTKHSRIVRTSVMTCSIL